MRVDPNTIVPGTIGYFDIFILRGGNFLLYCKQGSTFNEEKLASMLDVTDFYIPVRQKVEYESYLAKNLGDMLQNERVPIEERSRLFYSISSAVMRKAITSKLPKQHQDKAYKEMLNIVGASIKFFSATSALKSFSQFISHTYKTYSHSIQVMVLLISLLQRFQGTDKKMLQECGMGALLHDIGKTEIPVEILTKQPDALDPHEWDIIKTHPAKGLNICSAMPLSRVSMNCILFHHEMMDGSGYPGGLTGESIPLEVRALSLCNTYDMLTAEKTYAPGLSPFDAMRVLQEDMHDAFDQKLYKRLVYILSDACIM